MHQSGEIINQRYQVRDVLGKGGVGITYSAVDTQTDSVVAIKAVSLKQLSDWKQIELFEREAQVLAKLDHPNISQYIDYFDIETAKDKVFYIVQQLAPGKSLFQLVQSGWRTTEAEVKQIAAQILSILDYLHSLKPPVIHRDLKPQNLILDESGKIYLVDFGAVQNTYYDTLMQGSTVVGTYGYMAPEQFRGKAVSATDLYSLGATLLFLLTHRSPAELPQNALKLDFKSQVNVSEAFVEWLEKILEPDAEDRFSSAKQALSVLKKKKFIRKRHKNKNNKRTIFVFIILILSIFSVRKLNSIKDDVLINLEFYQQILCSNRRFAKNYLKQEQDINIVFKIGNENKSFVSCLIGAKDTQIIKLLTENQDIIQDKKAYNEIMLLRAIRGNNAKEVAKLINKELDINVEFTIKKSRYLYLCAQSNFLYEAISQDNLEIVKLLIENGININSECIINPIQGDEDRIITPLSRAIYLKRVSIVKLLIEKGATIDYDSIPITLAKIIAAENNPKSIAILKLLLQNGLDPNKDNEFGKLERLSVIDPNYVKGPGRSEKFVYYDSLRDFAKKRGKNKVLSLFYEFNINKNDR